MQWHQMNSSNLNLRLFRNVLLPTTRSLAPGTVNLRHHAVTVEVMRRLCRGRRYLAARAGNLRCPLQARPSSSTTTLLRDANQATFTPATATLNTANITTTAMAPVAGTDYVEQWIPGFGGHQFYTRTYASRSPRAVVLFVHGFAEHIGRYEHAHVKYPPRGITVFAFDLRGYGRTALDKKHKSNDSAYGKTNWEWQMQDIEFFGRYLKKEYPDVPLILMGHSAVRSMLHG